MKNREIVIRLQLPRAPRLRWLVGGAAVILCSSALVYAALTQFAPNTPIKSADVNANFANLDTRLSKLEAVEPTSSPAPANDWQNYNANDGLFGYFKDPFGVVHLRGTLVEPSNAHQVIYTLPTGYRPAKVLVFLAGCSGNGTSVSAGLVYVQPSGNIVPDSSCAATGWMTIEGITFRAEQ